MFVYALTCLLGRKRVMWVITAERERERERERGTTMLK